MPPAQALVGGRAMWSRPVAEDWAEARRRSRDGVERTMADRDHSNLPVGVVRLWEYFTGAFTIDLWDRDTNRKRFALRWRTKPAAAAAVLWLSTITVNSSYTTHVLPAIFATAFGFALGFVPLTLTAVHGVRAQDSGIASALLNAAQQLGVALGLAVVSTVSVTASAARLPDALTALHRGQAAGDAAQVSTAGDALVHGYTTALFTGALVLAAAAAVTALLVNATSQRSAAGHSPANAAVA